MNKPKLELDLKPIIEKQIIERSHEKKKTILRYTLEKNGFAKNFDPKKLSTSSEYLNDSTRNSPVLTFRYDKIFLFREVTIDKEGLHFKYFLSEYQIN